MKLRVVTRAVYYDCPCWDCLYCQHIDSKVTHCCHPACGRIQDTTDDPCDYYSKEER